MNPYPLFTLNHFTVPVTLVAETQQLKTSKCYDNHMKNCVLAKTVASKI
jgi:beta-glucosidase/6-phospho-beta-glucosidase/beta-galactosidase